MIDKVSPVFEFKLAGSESSGIFEGYASTFGGLPDSYGDLINPGSFKDTLKDHATKGTAPALLWAHDPTEPIGKWLTLAEDRFGLAVKGKLTLGTKRGAEARELMKDGALGLSIGYKVPPGTTAYEGNNRILKAINLLEISAVAIPANPSARIHGVKSIDFARPENIREFESALRDACGFSHREAKRIASVGWSALRRDDSDELKDICALLQGAAAEFKSY